MSVVVVDYILLGLMIALGIWDLFLVADDQDRNTISWRTRQNGKRTLLIPFYFGVLGGHFFHPMTPEYVSNLHWIVPTLSLACGTVVSLIYSFEDNPSNRNLMVFAFFLVGVVVGVFAWPV